MSAASVSAWRTSLSASDLRHVGRAWESMADVRPLGVAFSGGVDSSVLLALAADALGPADVVALLGISASLARREEAAARAVAESIGVRVVEIPTRELDDPRYVANGPDRCYFCKDELFRRIDSDVITSLGLAGVAYGENADDARRIDRPGARAASEHRVLRPLADAGIDKAMVRRIAAAMALPIADKPAAPCLASRIPHFSTVTATKLRQVEHVEDALHDLGFTEARARHHDDIVRIEVPQERVAELLSEDNYRVLQRSAWAAGFREAVVDRDGMKSGAFTMAYLRMAEAG